MLTKEWYVQNMRFNILGLCFLISIHFISFSAFGDCTGSYEGTIAYDTVDNRLEYCDFNVWRSMKYNQTKTNVTTIYDQDFESGVAGSE